MGSMLTVINIRRFPISHLQMTIAFPNLKSFYQNVWLISIHICRILSAELSHGILNLQKINLFSRGWSVGYNKEISTCQSSRKKGFGKVRSTGETGARWELVHQATPGRGSQIVRSVTPSQTSVIKSLQPGDSTMNRPSMLESCQGPERVISTSYLMLTTTSRGYVTGD